MKLISDFLPEGRLYTQLPRITDMIPKSIRPTSSSRSRVFPIGMDIPFRNTVSFLHMLVVELRHEQMRRFSGMHHKKEWPLQGLATRSRQIVQTVIL